MSLASNQGASSTAPVLRSCGTHGLESTFPLHLLLHLSEESTPLSDCCYRANTCSLHEAPNNAQVAQREEQSHSYFMIMHFSLSSWGEVALKLLAY